MCLRTIDEELVPDNKVQMGYKIMYQHGEDSPLMFPYFGLGGHFEVPRGVWLTATRKWIESGSSEYYKSGFHILPTWEDALTLYRYMYYPGNPTLLRLVSVKYRQARLKGTEGHAGIKHDVVVADQIMFGEEIPVSPVDLKPKVAR